MDEWVEARDRHGRLICLVNITTGEIHIRKAGRDYFIAVKNGLVVTTLMEMNSPTSPIQPQRSEKDRGVRLQAGWNEDDVVKVLSG